MSESKRTREDYEVGSRVWLVHRGVVSGTGTVVRVLDEATVEVAVEEDDGAVFQCCTCELEPWDGSDGWLEGEPRDEGPWSSDSEPRCDGCPVQGHCKQPCWEPCWEDEEPGDPDPGAFGFWA